MSDHLKAGLADVSSTEGAVCSGRSITEGDGGEKRGKAGPKPQNAKRLRAQRNPAVAQLPLIGSDPLPPRQPVVEPPPLFNDPPPNILIESERPEHRMILYLKMQGMSNQEIATQVGYSYGWVCQVIRQDWFRANFVKLIEQKGGDACEAFLKGTAFDVLETLDTIRATSTSDAVRVAACNALADRIWGKPVAHVKNEKVASPDDAQRQVADLERELAYLRKREIGQGLSPNAN